MDKQLILAIITITLALVFYTIGVFGERKSQILKKWHVLIFWLGLVCDTTGTLIMENIAKLQVGEKSHIYQMVHGVTGGLAIFLMIFHAVWATWVLIKNDEDKKQAFHKFSIIVWVIWLIPYFIGMAIGMIK